MRSATTWLCALGMAAASCNGGQSGEPITERFDEARSPLERDRAPRVASEELTTLADGNRAFALGMYGELVRESPENGLFFSPFSISVALAMTYAGAAGTTAEAIAGTLHFELEEPGLHQAFNALDLALSSRGEGAQGKDDEPFRLHVTNSIWGLEGAMFLDPFLDTLAVNYGAGLRLLDFAAQPEPSRKVINEWVEDQTEDRIMELIPEGGIDSATVLVLVNAIYFNAAWAHKFDDEATAAADFTTLSGATVSVPMMSALEPLGYYEAAGVRAVEKRYDGDELSMVLIVPDDGTLPSFEDGLSSASLRAILDGLQLQTGTLSMPKWRHEGETISLRNVLTMLGMGVAFGDAADFSRMGTGGQISDVYHQAFVEVDETGTEAAAATAVVIRTTSGPPPSQFTLTIDRPFIYLIRDIATDTILFMGRVTDPS